MSRSLEPREGRRLYGQDPGTYALGRPDYPERVYERLASRCGLAEATRVIEVGPGTGLVTRRLLGAGAHVTGIEPNAAMSAYLGRTIADAALDVIVEAFEDVDVSPDSFDLAVAATSFHWVSQTDGMRQFRRLLRRGGWAAIWWMLCDDPEAPDDLTSLVEDRCGGFPGAPTSAGDPPFQLDTAARSAELADAGFLAVESEVIRSAVVLDAASARALYASMAIVLRLPPEEQADVLNAVEATVDDRFGGRLERQMVTAMYTARNR
jgi:SAM-dependent methyltransferase